MLWASDPVRAEYRAVSEAVRAVAPRPRYSDEFVEGYVDDLLQGALDNPERIGDLVASLRQQLKHEVVTLLYIPLDGVEVEDAELRLGSVRLVRMDDATFERLVIQPFVDIIGINPRYDAAAADHAIEDHRARLQALRGRTCVEVTSDIDLAGTFKAVEAVIEDVCDFLQVCVAALVPRRPTSPVRWSIGVFQAWSIAFAVSDGPRPRSNSNAKLAYGGPPTPLGAPSLVQLQDYGLLPLANALGTAPATEYQSLLRRAVRWFAKGERERHPDDRKLAYVTAVDLFFSQQPGPGGDERGVTQRFCEGLAFALRDGRKDVARVARSMVGVYRSRSETSHEGAFDVASDEAVDQFRWTVLEFLSRMAAHPFQTKADVEGWVAERRAALTDEERKELDEATGRRVVEQDAALTAAIALLAAAPARQTSPEARRQRFVLSRLLIDAARTQGSSCCNYDRSRRHCRRPSRRPNAPGTIRPLRHARR